MPVGIKPVAAPHSGDTLTAGRLALPAGLAALGALATNIMLPAFFPTMARELGVIPRELSWTLSSFFIVFAVGQLLVGPLSDTVGRAPFVVGGSGHRLLLGRVRRDDTGGSRVHSRLAEPSIAHGQWVLRPNPEISTKSKLSID